jgi:hypothetical protein
MSEGQGEGDRPIEETDVGYFDTKARQKVGRGSASIVGEVEGPNLVGDVRQEVQEVLESAESRSVDPLTDQKMPRSHRGHAREYFDRLREGQ